VGSFLENLKKIFTLPAEDSVAGFVTFMVKCEKCGEEITVKVRRDSDLSRLFEGEGPAGAEYFLRKEILGEKCNNLISIEVYFGPTLNIISREINGGKFVG